MSGGYLKDNSYELERLIRQLAALQQTLADLAVAVKANTEAVKANTR